MNRIEVRVKMATSYDPSQEDISEEDLTNLRMNIESHMANEFAEFEYIDVEVVEFNNKESNND